jgi:MtrB/PioB family decaheme-associated outer membrane protein
MNMKTIRPAFRLTAIAAAVAGIGISGQALAEDDLAEYTRPESSVSFGIGYLADDNARFGMYSGLREQKFHANANVDYIQRDPQSAAALRFRGRNLGLESRELRFDQYVQGLWGYFVEYGETVRHSPYTINTGLLGIGTENLDLLTSPTVRSDVQLRTKREKTSLGYDRTLGDGLSLQVRFANEEKDGARIFGRGTTGGNGNFNFLAEPINTTTQQLEATLAYASERFQLSGGYYGSLFANHYPQLNIVGGGAGLNGAGAGTFSPIALPPGNEAHQLFVSGGYAFTAATRGSFKASYAKATQDKGFVSMPGNDPTLNISGRTDLGGEVDTTLIQLGLTSRLMPKLTLSANLRYEDRDDKTPVVQYISTTATGNHDGTNEARSFTSTLAKVEAAYQLSGGFRGIAGVDYEIKERSTSAVRSVSHRDETNETTVRLEVRGPLHETLSASAAYLRSDRDGSEFYFNRTFNGTNSSNLVAPIHLADRQRDRVRLGFDWAPTEALSLQFTAEQSWDEYDTRFDLGIGVNEGRASFYALDSSFTLTDEWKLNAWLSRSELALRQRSTPGAAANPATPAAGIVGNVFESEPTEVSNALGVGVKGQILGNIDVGVDLQYSDDKSRHWISNLNTATDVSIPDVRYETTTVRLFGSYPVSKQAGVRVDYVHDRRVIDDWTWRSWVYNATTAAQDGTTIRQDGVQKTSFIGVSGYYKWW